jgi:hypothetical protein
MQAMISLGMEYPDNNDIAAFNPVKQLVWKSMRQHPPKTSVIHGVPFRRTLEQTDSTVNLVEELAAQKRALRFIPAGGFAQVLLGFGTKNNAPTHR